MQLTISALFVVLILASAVESIGICAMYIRPYSDNAYSWQQCGITAAPDALMAADVEFYDPQYGCDTNAGYVLTDCAESESCAVYGDCSGPETALPVPEYPPPLQAGWSVDMPCAVDNPQRVLANVIVSYLPSTTPYSCTGLCGSKGYQYAGVEYGDECYCGTGYVDNVMPPAANLSDCSMLCAGGYYFNCGGSWRMQIYKFN